VYLATLLCSCSPTHAFILPVSLSGGIWNFVGMVGSEVGKIFPDIDPETDPTFFSLKIVHFKQFLFLKVIKAVVVQTFLGKIGEVLLWFFSLLAFLGFNPEFYPYIE
jgi:hypothetical protein